MKSSASWTEMHAVENCCPTWVLKWQNLCIIHMRVTITYSYTKCSKLKCTASIYTTQTVSYWVNVHQHAVGSMCLCRNAPDTHHNQKRSPQLFLQECVSLPLYSSHTLSSSLQTSPVCVNVHCFLTLSEIFSLLLPFSWKKILQLADLQSPVWNPEGRCGALVSLWHTYHTEWMRCWPTHQTQNSASNASIFLTSSLWNNSLSFGLHCQLPPYFHCRVSQQRDKAQQHWHVSVCHSKRHGP